MAKVTSDSENEFEDAVDQLPTNFHRPNLRPACLMAGREGGTHLSSPGTAAAPPLPASTVRRSSGLGGGLHRDEEVDERRFSLQPASSALRPSSSQQFQFDTSAPKPSSRHSRLEVLRSRMRAEFSSASVSSRTGLTDDEGMGNSECTSLASWGRNLLAEHEQRHPGLIPTCTAVDSLSTRGLSSGELVHIPPTTQTLKHPQMSVDVIEDGRATLNSPPPVYPPPPLPNRNREEAAALPCPAHTTFDQQQLLPSPCQNANLHSPTTTSVTLQSTPPRPPPPPLPPRKAPPQTTKTDTAPVEEIEPRTRLDSTETKTAKEAEKVETSSSYWKQELSPQLMAGKLGSNTTSSTNENYGKKRGHMKTNSLDRGLSLAKSMKCGPFPPPSSSTKSNSLNRSTQRSDHGDTMVEECEEDQMDQNAHGVIQQLTLSVLSNTNSSSGSDTFANDTAVACSKETPKSSKQHSRIAARTISEQYPSRGASRELSTVGEEGPATTPVHSPTMESVSERSDRSDPDRSVIQSSSYKTHGEQPSTAHYENLSVEEEGRRGESEDIPETAEKRIPLNTASSAASSLTKVLKLGKAARIQYSMTLLRR